jgi:hypothetical protein
MSRIALSGNASGTGTFTIASPDSNSDRTLNLPDSAGTLATAESTLTQFSASGSAPVFAARAWVNFADTTIKGSGNVSSITNVTTGIRRVNFTTAMPDVNYSVVSSAMYTSSSVAVCSLTTNGTSNTAQVEIATVLSGFNSLANPTEIYVAVFR